MTAGQHLVCCHPILGCVPIGCHSWCYCQKRVMVAKLPVGTEGTLIVHALPAIHTGQPLMRQSTGTLVTFPPDKHTTARLNLNVSNVLVSDMMPLLLHLWLQQADVWPLKLHQRLLDLSRATARALTSSCSAEIQWRHGWSANHDDHSHAISEPAYRPVTCVWERGGTPGEQRRFAYCLSSDCTKQC